MQCNAESAVKSSEEGINQPKTSKALTSTLEVATELVVQGYMLVQMIIKKGTISEPSLNST